MQAGKGGESQNVVAEPRRRRPGEHLDSAPQQTWYAAALSSNRCPFLHLQQLPLNSRAPGRQEIDRAFAQTAGSARRLRSHSHSHSQTHSHAHAHTKSTKAHAQTHTQTEYEAAVEQVAQEEAAVREKFSELWDARQHHYLKLRQEKDARLEQIATYRPFHCQANYASICHIFVMSC